MKFIYCLPALGIFSLLSGGMALWLKAEERGGLLQTPVPVESVLLSVLEERYGTVLSVRCPVFAPGAVYYPFITSNMRQDIPAMYPYDIVCTAYETDLWNWSRLRQTRTPQFTSIQWCG